MYAYFYCYNLSKCKRVRIVNNIILSKRHFYKPDLISLVSLATSNDVSLNKRKIRLYRQRRQWRRPTFKRITIQIRTQIVAIKSLKTSVRRRKFTLEPIALNIYNRFSINHWMAWRQETLPPHHVVVQWHWKLKTFDIRTDFIEMTTAY